MGWLTRMFGREEPTSAAAGTPAPARPAPPTGPEILASVDAVQARTDGVVPPAVVARIARISGTVDEMVPRLDRLGVGNAQAHTVVATATSYLPEAVGAYLRLPRDFADTQPVDRGRTALMILCDQLDLLGRTLDQISDAVSRQDANALIAHGRFLEEKFAASTPATPASPGPSRDGAPPTAGPARLSPPGGSA